MSNTVEPDRRTAAAPDRPHAGHVTLINSFVVPEGRDEAFVALWTQASRYFREQPGFLSLRLHRALSPDAAYRFVNVAEWVSHQAFAAAHRTAQFKELIARPAWREFASNPVLYEVTTQHAVAGAQT